MFILLQDLETNMKKYKWYWTLIAVSLIVLIGSAAGCITTYQGAPEESVPPCASPNNIEETSGLPTSYPPVINSFTASPETISPGQSVTLSWDVSGATTLTIHPAIDSAGSSGVEYGIEQVSPTTTTTYTLTATNEAGNSTSSITVTVTSTDDTLIGCDPVSGRNQEIDFTWEQFCLSSQYQVQIATDPGFTQIVFDSGVFVPPSSTSSVLLYPAGGILQAGHTYYWRVRVRGDAWGGFICSSWSKVKSFTIKAGLPVTTSYYGLQLLFPSNSCIGCPVKPASFSWSPFKDTTKYKFVLAKDAAMTDIMVEAEATNTAYEYNGTLDYSSNYFWRVMSLEPAPSDWSATFSFQTEAVPAPPPPPAPAPVTPLWVWVVITIGGILVVATLVLTFMTRRV